MSWTDERVDLLKKLWGGEHQMTHYGNLGERRFGRVNWLGLAALMRRETRRFLAIWAQTVLAPMVTAGLFLLIFTIAVGPNRGPVMGLPFTTFLAPGLLMMTVIQNAFANTSSSLMAAKVQGNIVDTLMPPLSPLEIVLGYVSGGIGRGLFVAIAMLIALWVFLGVEVAHPLWTFAFLILGGAFMGCLGLIAATLALKLDQMAAITNFLITPLAFLSGTFYSVTALPPALQAFSRINPIFYLIDGARFGIIGVSDSDPRIGIVVVMLSLAAVLTLCWAFFRTGYRLKD